MSTPTHRDWPNTSQWLDARGHGQPSQRHQERRPDPPISSSESSTSGSVETDPSEDSSEDSDYVPDIVPETMDWRSDSVGENSPNSLSELGLRDHSDPGLEGSHQGHGRMSIDPLDPIIPVLNHRSNASLVGPVGQRNDDRPEPSSGSSSGSPAVTSRIRYPDLGTPPMGLRRGRDGGHARRAGSEGREPVVAEPVRGNAGDSMVRELREVMGRMRSGRRHRERHGTPPPDFLKMVMTMQSLGTTKFYGDKGPIVADSWVRHIERNFSAARCPDDFKTDVAAHYLMKDACYWWDGVKLQYAGTQITWGSFRREFERKYFPPEARDRMEAQFQTLVQGQKTVREYESEFTRLRPYAHYSAADEPIVIRKFLRGLRSELKSRLVVVQYYSLFELVERAVDVEECIGIEQAAEDRVDHKEQEKQQAGPKNQVTRTGTQGKGRGQGRGQASGRGRGAAGRGTPTMEQLPVCFKCGGRGHFARACPKKGKTSRPVPDSVICFTCNQPGHYASSCPVTHPTGQIDQEVGLRALEWEDEPPAKRPAIEGRVYSLDKPGPSKSAKGKGPVTGT